MIRTAVFHGSLAKQFGKTHKFAADTVHLLTKGLILQLGDAFEQTIRNGNWQISLGKPITRRMSDREARDCQIKDEQVHQQLGKATEVHFYPEVKGDASGRWVTAIVGVVLIVVGAVLTYFGYGSVGIPMMKMGAMMVITGTISALSQKPTVPNQGGTSNPNFFFNGGANTNQQGVPVPLVFGHCARAGSVVISQGVTAGRVA